MKAKQARLCRGPGSTEHERAAILKERLANDPKLAHKPMRVIVREVFGMKGTESEKKLGDQARAHTQFAQTKEGVNCPLMEAISYKGKDTPRVVADSLDSRDNIAVVALGYIEGMKRRLGQHDTERHRFVKGLKNQADRLLFQMNDSKGHDLLQQVASEVFATGTLSPATLEKVQELVDHLR